ncbi:flagellar filament capping protein FliD [Niveibacterium sp. SC-1]|uniref:flagellar filament capping protein FliD n=1 Tax=Niveibacterium sp. SC-1 TaxID=3135646 RepID=UPI0031200247
MGITSSVGLATGLNVDDIVSKLMSAEQQPAVLLQQKSTKLSTQLSAFGQIKSVMSSLQDATTALGSADKYAAMSARVSDSSALSATSSTSALAGSYNVKVLNLAQGQRVASNSGVASSVAAGTLTIQLGTYSTDSNNVTTFSAASTAATPINFTGSTLTELRDSINAAKTGVTASIVNDGTSDRLVLASDGVGGATGFQISGTDGLSGLSYDASTAASSNSFSSLQSAQDSKIEVQGLTITRSSNTVENAIPGVTLNLTAKTTTDPVVVTVSKDNSQATTAVQNLVKAYNGMISTMNAMTSYNKDSNQASVLTGDASIASMRNLARGALTQSVKLSDGSSMRFSDMGVTLQKDGTLAVDTTKLNKALTEQPARVAEFLAGNSSTTGLSKLASKTLDSINGTNGSLAGKTKGLQSSIDSIGKQLDSWNTRLTAIEARYRAQFTALETTISSMQSTQTYLTQQLAALPGFSS